MGMYKKIMNKKTALIATSSKKENDNKFKFQNPFQKKKPAPEPIVIVEPPQKNWRQHTHSFVRDSYTNTVDNFKKEGPGLAQAAVIAYAFVKVTERLPVSH